MQTIATLVIAGAAFLFLGVYFLIDYIITRHRLKINQNAWDEYSANMDFNRKVYAYLPWCIEQKNKKRVAQLLFSKILRSKAMKITEMNNCIEEMRKCYNFDNDKTEITLGDSTSSSTRCVNVYTKDENGTRIEVTRYAGKLNEE